MKFCEKLIRLRKIKGITQDEFASAVGVSRQAVYKWESGQSYPEVAKLIEIKRLFEISIDDLLDENYEIALPEKKKRKRAMPKIEIAENVGDLAENKEENLDEIPHAPVSMPTEPEKEEVVTEKAEVSEKDFEEKTEEEKIPANVQNPITSEPQDMPKAEEEKTEATEQNKNVAEEKAEDKKKIGFFGRLFGRR